MTFLLCLAGADVEVKSNYTDKSPQGYKHRGGRVESQEPKRDPEASYFVILQHHLKKVCAEKFMFAPAF